MTDAAAELARLYVPRKGGAVQVILVGPLHSAISGTWLDGSGLDHAPDIVVNGSGRSRVGVTVVQVVEGARLSAPSESRTPAGSMP